MSRVCIVGAGPAGLVATKTLGEAGLEIDCVEASPVIGGQWVVDNPNGRSAVYRSIETNTTRAMSRLSDFAMPAEWLPFREETYDALLACSGCYWAARLPETPGEFAGERFHAQRYGATCASPTRRASPPTS